MYFLKATTLLSALGRQPGFSVYSLFKNTKRHLLVIEIKPKNEDCNSDLVKLANEMKDIIDKYIDDNIIGNQCSVYAMDLKYDGIYYYRLILLDKFFLPRNCYDLGVIPASIEALTVVKAIITKLRLQKENLEVVKYKLTKGKERIEKDYKNLENNIAELVSKYYEPTDEEIKTDKDN
nr:10891_t:CDS:2 [Entrophospora candida]